MNVLVEGQLLLDPYPSHIAIYLDVSPSSNNILTRIVTKIISS